MSDEARKRERKDRLIQTRVPKTLEERLKEEAEKQRLSVSHLLRNILEDTFNLVDGVVVEVDNIVGHSTDLAVQVGEDAKRVAKAAKRGVEELKAVKESLSGGPKTTKAEPEAESEAAAPTSEPAPEPEPDPLGHVLAWNAVTLNRAASCARCAKALSKGDPANLGLSGDPSTQPTWLCGECLLDLQS